MHHRFIQGPVKHTMEDSSKTVNISSKVAINEELPPRFSEAATKSAP